MKVLVKPSFFVITLVTMLGQGVWASDDKHEEHFIFIASIASITTRQQVFVEVDKGYDWGMFKFNETGNHSDSLKMLHLNNPTILSPSDSNNSTELTEPKNPKKNRVGCLRGLLSACRRSARNSAQTVDAGGLYGCAQDEETLKKKSPVKGKRLKTVLV
jgi:hypothetical protein